MIAIVLGILLVVALIAIALFVAFQRAVMEQYQAVVKACDIDAEAFGRELGSGKSMQEVAAAHDVDAELVIRTTMESSRYRWLAKAASKKP